MNVLGLDLGTRCGWALLTENDGNAFIDSGSAAFEPDKHEDDGWRWIRFNAWLYGTWAPKKLTAVVMERVLPIHKQRATAQIAWGFETRVEEFCARERVMLKTVHNATLKVFATGNGRADKFAMMKFGRQLWPGLKTHDECDALFLLEYARKVIFK